MVPSSVTYHSESRFMQRRERIFSVNHRHFLLSSCEGSGRGLSRKSTRCRPPGALCGKDVGGGLRAEKKGALLSKASAVALGAAVTARVLILFLGLVLISSSSTLAQEGAPRSLDPRLKIELFAENPQIVTPTGIDVDSSGRVWAIESNTHFPPDEYRGHPTDRVLVMQTSPSNSKPVDITVFRDGLIHSMSVVVKPDWLDAGNRTQSKKTEVYIATRDDIFLCTDSNGDLKSDDEKRIIHLDTVADYPHNALAGFAFDASGYLYFGFGENKGEKYRIIGSDGTTLQGGGEGGNVYRCLPDGSKLERWSTGFWNPHASCFDAFGRLFSLDNDPDSRPPCRLLHLIEGGDYGYRYRNGRKGTHPFTSWNGEIPGTLPMVSGTGEAPSGIVCYEADGFPADYLGTLLVGSWGDHRIDKFVLKQRGTSFESMPQPIVTGGENFRPVGLAVAPDGSLYFTDWVLKEYKLHSKGRIWRLSAVEPPNPYTPTYNQIRHARSTDELLQGLDSPVLNSRRLAVRLLASSDDGRKALDQLRHQSSQSPRRAYEINQAGVDPNPVTKELDLATVELSDPFVFSRAMNQIAGALRQAVSSADSSAATMESLAKVLRDTERNLTRRTGTTLRDQELQQSLMLLATRDAFAGNDLLVRQWLHSKSPGILRLAIQWVGEERLQNLRPDVERILASEPMTTDLFMACLASLSLLDGKLPNEFEKTPPAKYLLEIVTDSRKPAGLRATALRILPANQKELDAKLLSEMLASSDAGLKREAVRTLQHSPIPERESLLRGIAADRALASELRSDAVAGLTGAVSTNEFDEATRKLLMELATSDPASNVRYEAIRSLRLPFATASTPRGQQSVDDLKRLMPTITGLPEPGRRSFVEAIEFGSNPVKQRSIDDLKALLIGNASGPSSEVDVERSIEAGRRAFFRGNGAGCFKCHTIGGRGGQVGPDLTVIARTMDRKKLVESILEPSREISPQYTTWTIETKSGKSLSGLLLGEEVNGDLRLGNNQGEIFFVPFADIETRVPSKVSIMPEKLHETMSVTELSDLVSFLETLK